MRETVRMFAAPLKRGLHYGFIGGRAYVLTPTYLGKYGQAHLSRHLVYMDALADLEAKYGHLIPDVEFVISTSDTPNQRPVLTGPGSRIPLLPARNMLPSRYQAANPITRRLRDSSGSRDELSRSAGEDASGDETGLMRDDVGDPAAFDGPSGGTASRRRLTQTQGALHYHTVFGVPGLPNGSHPILRASKSDAFPADILIPSHDFYLLRYDSTVLNASAAVVEALPWKDRSPLAYAHYDMNICRHRHPLDPTTFRPGVDRVPICHRGNAGVCFTRRHFQHLASTALASLATVRHTAVPETTEHYHLVDLHTPRKAALAAARDAAIAAASAAGAAIAAASAAGAAIAAASAVGAATVDTDLVELVYGNPDDVDGWAEADDASAAGSQPSSSSGLLPGYLADAARHRVLIHLDGRGLSSSLERLLPLGGVVLAEQSGYYGYFHRAMEPYVHYLPWWEHHGPQDIFMQLDWIQQDNNRAAAIAAAGRDFALRLLTAQGRACYWLALLQRLAATLRYTPRMENFPKAMPVRLFKAEFVLRTRPGRGQRPLFGQPFEP